MKKMSWEECLKGVSTIQTPYSIGIDHQKILYELAYKLPKKSLMLELGVCFGRTAATLCYVAKHKELEYYGIDDFSLIGSLEQVLNSLGALGLPHHIIEDKTEEVDWHWEVDLLVIDAGHHEEAIKQDCEKYIPFVKPGRYVVFHDYEKKYNPKSAHRAIHYYAEKITGEWETYALDRNLLIRKKPLT